MEPPGHNLICFLQFILQHIEGVWYNQSLEKRFIKEKNAMTQQEYLFASLKESVSAYACVADSFRRLKDAGFETLDYKDSWNLMPGGKYVLNYHDATLFAFTVGKDYRRSDMLRMAAAHTDYPCLRIKPSADFKTDVYAQVNLEVYGGPILNTWYDRPLGIAGRVIIRSEDPFTPQIRLFDSKKPVMIIPNLAIHMIL